MSIAPAQVEAGLRHLRRADPVMRRLIDEAGPFVLRLKRERFPSLVRAIIAQQISTHAARSIRRRLVEQLAPGKISPATLAGKTPAQLRRVGLSRQKSAYLMDLARRVQSGRLCLNHLHRRTDYEVVAELIQVKGIGVWTAQMFLIFCLGRPDVFPHADLGIRTALRNLYRLEELPDEETSHAIARPWRPFATMASWYCWRSLELKAYPGNGQP